MSNSKYYYVVSEIHIGDNSENVISQRVFDWKDKDLEELKNVAHSYFDERKRLIEFWIALDIYEMGEDHIFELNIKLAEASETGTREILTKSLTKVVGQSNLDYEANVITEDKQARSSSSGSFGNNGTREQDHVTIEIPRSQLKELKTKDYYQILGIGYDATSEQIEKAYSVRQSLAGGSMWHPNWHPSKSTYSNMEVYYKAYTTLSNPLAKAKYDEGISGKIDAAAVKQPAPECEPVIEAVIDITVPIQKKLLVDKADTTIPASKKFSLWSFIKKLFGM
jgi:hypothetical protein